MMLNMVQSLNQAMHQEMERDPRVLVLGEDVGVDGGVFRLTEGLLEKFGQERVIDTPLAESAIVGTSIGMAVAGLRPIAEIQFLGFIYLAMNQIISHAARLRNRSRGRFTVPIVIRTPYGAGVKALEHHPARLPLGGLHVPIADRVPQVGELHLGMEEGNSHEELAAVADVVPEVRKLGEGVQVEQPGLGRGGDAVFEELVDYQVAARRIQDGNHHVRRD